MPDSSIRRERAESSRLAWAFVLSLLLHLLIFGTYKTGKNLGWWHVPAWLQSSKMLTALLKKTTPPPPEPRELPLIFVDVSPAQATPEPPKDTKYYSDKNSKAANPDAQTESNIPKIEGQQTQIVKTEDIPREKFVPLQPSRPVTQPQEAQEESKPKPTQSPGDLALAKPDPQPNKEQGQQETHQRPRKLAEARALPKNQAQNRLVGEKMKQEGGVRRRLEIASLDARATEFGAYDHGLVEAIQQSWFGLLDQQSYASDYRGKVVIQFRLHYDGSITDLTVVESTAGEIPSLICQTAVDKPKPFEKFSPDMRRMVGDIRNILFTFYYN